MNINFNVVKSLLPVLLSILFSIFLSQMPLTDIFHYEYALVFSIINYFLAAITYFSKPLTIQNKNISKYSILSLINLIPFAISFIITFFFKTCNPLYGIPFYITFSIVASFVGWIVAFFSEYQSTKYRILIFLILTSIIFIEPVLEIYLLPQIYFYNSVLTFFPGTIYDEDISLTWKIITYRMLTIFIYVSIYYLIKKYKNRLKKSVIIPLAYIFFMSQFFIKIFTPYQTDIGDIHKYLGGKISTEHFNIYYPRELNNNQIFLLTQLHEFYYEEIKSELEDDVDGRISSFIFHNSMEKRELFGAENADVAKPWSRQIFMELDNYENVLKHELAHIFSRKYGKTIFMIADYFNPTMIEGFATALDYKFKNEDLFYLAYLLDKSGYKLSFETFFNNLNFFGHVPSVGYLYSGAFIRYLIEQYGINRIKKLYGNLDFYKIYGKSVLTLENEFYNFIESKDYSDNEFKVQLYFKGLPLIKKSCVHEISLKLKNAYLLSASGQANKAAIIFKNIYAKTTKVEALAGYVDALILQKKYDKAISILKSEINKVKKSSYYFYLKFKLGDLYIIIGDNFNAEKIFADIASMDLNMSSNIQSKFRLCLLKENADIFRKYFDKNLDKESIFKLIGNCNKLHLSVVLNKEIQKYPDIYKSIKNYLINEFVLNDVNELRIYLKSLNLFINNNDYNALEEALLKLKSQKSLDNNSIINEQVRKYEWLINKKGKS